MPPDPQPVADRHTAERVNLVPLLSAARVTVVAGKGGVGKTTVTAVLATAAAHAGLRVLAVELDGKPTLAELVGDVPHVAISARLALEEYLRDHGFGRVAKRLSSSGVIDVVSTAAPGIDDIVVLGKIKQLARGGDWDVIVVDGPATGHAVTMLTSAAGLQGAVTGGPVRKQADEVLDLLHDPSALQVALVTLAETTPVSETIETAFTLEDRVGVRLAPTIVNAVDVRLDTEPRLAELAAALPDDNIDRAGLVSAAAFRDERRHVQRAALARLAESLPVGQVHVPWVSSALIDHVAVSELARSACAAGSVADVRASDGATG